MARIYLDPRANLGGLTNQDAKALIQTYELETDCDSGVL